MSRRLRVAAVIPAAGLGRRLRRRTPKAFIRVGGKPLFIHTILALQKALSFQVIVLVVDRTRVREAERLMSRYGISAQAVAGGATRAESVWNGLKRVTADCDIVLVHDAARPLVTPSLVRDVAEEAAKSGACLCAVPTTSTVKRIDPRRMTVRGTEDRNALYLAQTPQAFKRALLIGRYQKLGPRAFAATDEAALFDGSRHSVKIVTGSPKNIKITAPEDLEFFERWHRVRHTRA